MLFTVYQGEDYRGLGIGVVYSAAYFYLKVLLFTDMYAYRNSKPMASRQMNYLQDYLSQAKRSCCRLGVFLAFNREQFDEGVAKHQDKKPSGTKWANLGMGDVHAIYQRQAFKTHTEMIEAAMATDVAESGRQGAKLNLPRGACMPETCMPLSKYPREGYGITADEVRSVFSIVSERSRWARHVRPGFLPPRTLWLARC